MSEAKGQRMNVGMNLLRILLTFGVVLDHFWLRENPDSLVGIERAIWHFRMLAVPAFMTMSFFFTARHFREGSPPWFGRRLVRLYEPFVFWAVAYWVLRMAIAPFDPAYGTSFADLLWQLALGSSRTLTMQFWFHADLIILTVLFFAAFRLVRTARAILWLAAAAVAVGFVAQYTPLNESLFGSLRFEMKYPLGRVFCMLPYAGIGLALAAAKPHIDSAPVGVRIAVVALGLALAGFSVFSPAVAAPAEVVGYEGYGLVLFAMGALAAFYYIPFARLPEPLAKAVLFVSRYCMGVYCVHLALGWLFYDYVLGLERVQMSYGSMRVMSLGSCLAVWVASYAFCWLFSRIPFGWCRRMVE